MSTQTDIYWGQHLRFPTLLPRSISRDQISWKILIRKRGQFNLNPPSENIYAANNSQFPVLGTLNLEVRCVGRSALIGVHVVNKPCGLLLSLQACRDLTVVPPYFPRSIDGPHVLKVSRPSKQQVDISQLWNISEDPSDANVPRVQNKFPAHYGLSAAAFWAYPLSNYLVTPLVATSLKRERRRGMKIQLT